MAALGVCLSGRILAQKLVGANLFAEGHSKASGRGGYYSNDSKELKATTPSSSSGLVNNPVASNQRYLVNVLLCCCLIRPTRIPVALFVRVGGFLLHPKLRFARRQ